MKSAMNLDPRIGKLNSSKFYAFPFGYDKPEVSGTLEEVEAALGLRLAVVAAPAKNAKSEQTWTVTMRFQYPAWGEVDGIVYQEITAATKAEANAAARRMADNDGHLHGGKGHVTFTANEQ